MGISLRAGRMKSRGLVFPLAVMLLAVGVQCLQPWGEALIFDRSAIGRGEWWRWFAGHVVHYSWSHLVADGIALVVGWWWIRPDHRFAAFVALLASVTLIPAVIWWGKPEWRFYAGTSGLAMTVMSMAAALWIRQPAQRRFGWMLTSLIAGKLIAESYTASPLFADFQGAPIEPATRAHVVGAMIGYMACWRRNKTPVARPT